MSIDQLYCLFLFAYFVSFFFFFVLFMVLVSSLFRYVIMRCDLDCLLFYNCNLSIVERERDKN